MREISPGFRLLILSLSGLCFFSIQAFGQEYSLGDPVWHKNLLVRPIMSLEQNDLANVITLDEGIASGLVQIEETGGGIEQQNQLNLPNQADVRDQLDQGPSQSGEQAPARTMQQQNPTVGERQVPGQVVEQQIEEQVQQLQNQSASAQVNSLRVVNNSDRYLFIAAGEVIKGGRQNRVVAKDSIIAPHESSTELEVFCVEQGRWYAYEESGSGFSSEKGLVAQNTLRKTILKEAEQGAVWDKVAALNKAQGVSSETDNYLEGIEESSLRGTAHKYIEPLLHSLTAEAVAGIIVEIDGNIEGLDIYFDPWLFKKHAEKILLAYAYDAVLRASVESTAEPEELGGKDPEEAALAFLQKALKAEMLTDTTNSTYRYMYLEGAGLSGGLLQLKSNGRLIDVHMTVVPAEIE